MPLYIHEVAEKYGYEILDVEPTADVLRISDGDDDYDTIAKVAALIQSFLPAAKPPTTGAVIWEKKIESQQLLSWGYGSHRTPDYIRFPTFVAVQNAALGGTTGGGFYDGSLVLRVTNRGGTELPVAQRMDTGGLRSSAAYTASTKADAYIERDKNKLQTPLPATGIWAEEGDRLQLLMQTKVVPSQTGTTAIDADDVIFEIPIAVIEF